MSARVYALAMTEDGEREWYERSKASRRQARRAAAADAGLRPINYRARRAYMRPFEQSDCDADVHVGEDGYDEGVHECACAWQAEEGYHYVCDADHPGAIPVWEVEWCPLTPRWLLRVRARIGGVLYPQPRTVVWGGRLERRTRRVERLLLGAAFYRRGDRWVLTVVRRAELEREGAASLEAWRAGRADAAARALLRGGPAPEAGSL